MITETTIQVNRAELEQKVKNMYRDVALQPKEKYHFEKEYSAGVNGQSDLPAYWLGNRIGQICRDWNEGKPCGIRCGENTSMKLSHHSRTFAHER